jgi:hypothetical protein
MEALTQKPPPPFPPPHARGRLGREHAAAHKASQQAMAYLVLDSRDALLGESEREVKRHPTLGVGLEYPVDHTAVKVNVGVEGRAETA